METIANEIRKLKKEKNTVILAHTYQPGIIQDVADFVGDSYGLSVEACEIKDAQRIIFCGVQFMAETAAILNPGKKVLMPVSDAGCPMADMITAEDLLEYKQQYPDFIVMCYVNSPAAVKALADVCCTSSNALKIAQQLPRKNGIIFVPDKYLGSWIQEQTSHTMILWEGFCPTHAHITPAMIEQKKAQHPKALVLIHPEAPKPSRDLADAVLSTGGMCNYVKSHKINEFIIATETGILHTLQKQNPEKRFYPVHNTIVCPNMKKTTLEHLLDTLEGIDGIEITVDDTIADKARHSLQKMLEMSK